MYEKFKKKLEKILDFYSIVNDREAIMKDLSEVMKWDVKTPRRITEPCPRNVWTS